MKIVASCTLIVITRSNENLATETKGDCETAWLAVQESAELQTWLRLLQSLYLALQTSPQRY